MFTEEKKRTVVVLRPGPRQNEALSRCSRATTAKEMYKKPSCKCKVVVLPI